MRTLIISTILCVLFVSLSATLYGQDGQIDILSNQNATWTLANSPIVIEPDPDFCVDDNAITIFGTLTIEAGVEVVFDDSEGIFSLIVENGGELYADGVEFKQSNGYPSGYNYWNGIIFEDNSDGWVKNSSLYYSNMGIEVHSSYPVPVIKGNIFNNCMVAMNFDGCNDTINVVEDNELYNCYDRAITCEDAIIKFRRNIIYPLSFNEDLIGFYLDNSDVIIEGYDDPEIQEFFGNISHNFQKCIYCYESSPQIRYLTFDSENYSEAYIISAIKAEDDGSPCNLTIIGNRFILGCTIDLNDNSFATIEDNGFDNGSHGDSYGYINLFDNSSADIINNVFWLPASGIWQHSTSTDPVLIANNVFVSADNSYSYHEYSLKGIWITSGNSKAEIFNNIFYNIDHQSTTGPDGFCIFVQSSTPGNNVKIYNNIFSADCNAAIVLTYSPSNDYDIDCRNNCYINMEGYKYAAFSNPILNLPDNYINESDPITTGYLDFYNPVEINPFNIDDEDFHIEYTSSCINTGYDDEDFNDPDGTVNDVGAYGGPNSLTPHYVLIPSDASDFDLTLPQATYKVEGDIMVDGTLTISPGANLQFVEAVGIIVDENYRLNCSGEEGNIITLQSYLGEGAWDGIRLETASSVLTEIEYTDIDNCVTCLRIDNTTLNQAVNNCSFTNSSSGVQVFNASTDVDECTFSNCNTAIFMNNSNSEIDSNDIEVDTDGIYIYGGSTFIIQGNTFTAGDNPEVGISIYNGSGQLIGNSFLEGIGEGLIFYNSAPKMKDNLIDNCSYCGMQLSGGSQPIMNFATFDAANRIANCGAEEIYISGYLFPLIRTGYNDLIDEDNPNDYIISANFTGDPEYIYDVRENYWLEATPEDARDRIYPSNEGYENFRIVCTSVCESSNTGYISTLDLDELLSQAFELEMNNQYSEAYDIYESIVASYSNDLAAVTAFSRMFYCYRALELNLQELLDFYDQVEESIEQYINMFYLKRIQAQTMRAMEDYNSALELLYDLTEFAQGATDSIFVLMDIESNLFEMGAGGGGIQSANSSDYSNPEAAWTNFAEKMKEFSSSLEDLSSNGDQALLQVPVEYGLLHLYPNPFNCNATIQYKVPELSNVIISIYTITGEKVCDLEKGINYAGEFKRTWLAENIASGVYFVNIDIDPLTGGKKLKEVSKLLLVK